MEDITVNFGKFKLEIFRPNVAGDDTIGITISTTVDHPIETAITDLFIKFHPDQINKGEMVNTQRTWTINGPY